MYNSFTLSFILSILLSASAFAQQAIIELDNDDTLPIAQTRYDDAVELPKDNFSSVNKNDMWEKFERGELDEKAFLRLQEDYQMAATNSKDPFVKRKIASDMKEKRREEFKKKKEEAALKLAEEKKSKKKAEANKFDNEIGMMAKEKEAAQKKAEAEGKKAQIEQAKIDAKNKKLAAKAVKKRTPASKKPKKLSKKKK